MKYINNALSWREINSSHNLMFAIVMTLAVFNFFFGEIVPEGGGFGWDGATYGKITRYLDSLISNGQLSNYHAKRILPSTIVRIILLLMDAPFSNINIIRVFEFYNLVVLIGALWVWKRLANNFSLSISGRWIGFCGIFMNFSLSKQAFYYPVLTDVTAIFVGLLLLLFYVEKRPVALFITTIVGAFVWQLASTYGAMLLIFLKTDISSDVIDQKIFASDRQLRFIKFFLFALILLSFVILALLNTVIGVAELSKIMYLLNKVVTIEVNTVDFHTEIQGILTAMPSVVALSIGLLILVGSTTFIKKVLEDLLSPRFLLLALAIAAMLIPWAIVNIISNPLLRNDNTIRWILIHAFLTPPNGKILLPFVALAVFWGPTVILMLLYWQSFCLELRKLGPGVVAIMALSLPLGLVTEPRYITAAWPFMVFALVLALEKLPRDASFNTIFAILTILFAKFWLKINWWTWPDTGTYVGLEEFPKQMYFLSYGFWMNWATFLIQLLIVVLSTVWLRKTMRPA